VNLIYIFRQIYDILISGCWTIYDIFLTLKYKLFHENYVGVCIRVMSPSERRLYFDEFVTAGGLSSAFCLIKIFADKDALLDEESFVDLIDHEVLHQVLEKVHPPARIALDNIHKPFIMLNCDSGKWKFYTNFVFLKNGRKIQFR